MEILVPAVILSGRFRKTAAVVGLVVTLMIQMGAREFFFASYMSALWMLFLPPIVAMIALPLYAVLHIFAQIQFWQGWFYT